jgi:hypothetical protein
MWESGLLQTFLRRDGNTRAWEAEGIGGYRAAVLVGVAGRALREHTPEAAAEWFRVFADKNMAPWFFSLELAERKRYLNAVTLRSLWPVRRGRPRDVVVAVRVCAVDCLAHVCGVRLAEAIKTWNREFPEYAYLGEPENVEAQFRVERRRLRSYLVPPKPTRGRGRPPKYSLRRRRHRANLSL